jgi:luciferase family oxidoreductase group 1
MLGRAVAPRLRLSALDLSPVPSGGSGADALRNTIDLARHVERLGFTRYWLAEHHNAATYASSAPEVMIAAVAAATRALRVGAGGIMLPNHRPLKVAEVFRVLHALHPGRIDLGLGRSPGTDRRTAAALRDAQEDGAPLFPDDLAVPLDALLAYLGDGAPGPPAIRAVPVGVDAPELWMLGSTDVGATLAARRGLGFCFAHHINPVDAAAVIRRYRAEFVPSHHWQSPTAILAVSVVCGPTDEAAERLASSLDLMSTRFGQGIRDLPVPTPEEATLYPYDADEETLRRLQRHRHVIGGPVLVRQRLEHLARETEVDELMISTIVHDHAARLASYARVAEALDRRSTRVPS